MCPSIESTASNSARQSFSRLVRFVSFFPETGLTVLASSFTMIASSFTHWLATM
jgi:hypothetical protein